jgi:hypothetical protein
LSLAVALLIAGALCAQGAPPKAPAHWHGPGTTVILHSGHTPIALAVGENIIDPPRRFNCYSAAGCIVIAATSVKDSDTIGAYSCALVDGAAGDPGCVFGSGTGNPRIVLTRQQFSVAQGQHTLQTVEYSDNAVGEVSAWEADYTIFELAVH